MALLTGRPPLYQPDPMVGKKTGQMENSRAPRPALLLLSWCRRSPLESVKLELGVMCCVPQNYDVMLLCTKVLGIESIRIYTISITKTIQMESAIGVEIH